MKRTLRSLEYALENAKTYAEWRDAAKEYDRLSGNEDWKDDDRSNHYDYELIRLRLAELRRARAHEDIGQLVFNLHEGLHGNLGNIANPELYRQTKIGTKYLICDYLREVCDSLNYLSDVETPSFGIKEKLDFFKTTGQAFGRSAMMLSGGATLGLFHLGVVKALWEEHLLPTIMSGSSAGSIMVAVMGTHTDEELADVFDPKYLYAEAFKLVGWKGWLRGRPLMDGDHLERCLDENAKDMTFEEAFKHTGRIINVTVSPYDHHQESRLLNTRTSPNVLIRKASLASCAIPGVFPPVTLWAKNIHGEKVPYIPTRKWVDGSIKTDLPFLRLARLYGVNHTIVSQTNPHVVPFLARDESTSPWQFMREMVAANLSMNVNYAFELLRRNMPANDIGLLLDKAQSVVRQNYVGDINIVPPRRPANLMKVLKNATPDDIQYFIESGERSTWPKLEMIRNTTCISRTFERCIEKLRQQEAYELGKIRKIPA